MQHLNDDLVKSWQRSQSSPSITTQKCSKEEIDRGQRHERKNFQKVCIAGNRTEYADRGQRLRGGRIPTEDNVYVEDILRRDLSK